MTTNEFENLLNRPESSTLDFKSCQYELLNDKGDIKTAAFVKDIISFSNTIRTETAYIIIGVKEKEDGTKELNGLDKNIDDAIFQSKIKNKVSPITVFSYYIFDYNNKKFGIIEIPLKKYSEPISATAKLKGIEPGKIYFRRNTSNSEAIGREVIMINKWLESLPEEYNERSISAEISELILKITSNKFPISESIANALQIANRYNVEKLKEFCHGELAGWRAKSKEDDSLGLDYRMSKVIASHLEIEMNPYIPLNSNQIIANLRKMEGFHELILLFPEPISEIEKRLNRINEKPDSTIITLKSTAEKLLNDNKLGDIPVTIYANRDNFENIYNGIKQKLINLLIEIK